MLDKLREIDTSALDQLSELKREEEILEDRLKKMEERHEAVSPVVYDRVQEDYQSRLNDLDDQARPLKAKGREEFAKLTALHAEAEEALEAARLDGEELQFRNELGEFPEEEFKTLSKESNKVVKERQSHVNEAEKLRTAFVEAFRSEEELAQEPAETEPSPVTEETSFSEGTAEIPEDPVPPELPPSSDDVDDTQRPPGSDTLPPTPEVEDLDATEFETDATRELDVDEEGAGEEEGEGEDRGEAPEEDLPPADPTIILTRARFVALDGPDADHEFILSESPATVGRAPDCHIRIPDESVSRHHAEVVEGPEGHSVFDLGSENGTFVNGEPIKERELKDGDVVQVGSCRLVFRV